MPGAAMVRLESLEAGEVAGVVRRWRTEDPEHAVLALVPEAEREGVGRLQEACRVEGVRLFGAVFPALVAGEAFPVSGAWLLRLDGLASGALVPELASDPAALGRAAEELVAPLRPHLARSDDLTLLLVFDAMYPCVGSLLDELYLRLSNRVEYAGANAGSETFRPMPCLFDGERTIGGGALVLLLRGRRGAVLEHGYRVPARASTATATAGNRIIQIDWRPAFEVYQTLARQQYGVEMDRESFYRLAVHLPFGVVRANGDVVVRIPVALEEDGSLFCVGEVAPNSVLALLEAPQVDSVATIEALERGLVEVNGPLEGKELLLFYCAGRRLHLGIPAACQEVAALGRGSRAARVGGALSLGELGSARQGDYPLFQNATLLAAAWGAR